MTMRSSFPLSNYFTPPSPQTSKWPSSKPVPLSLDCCCCCCVFFSCLEGCSATGQDEGEGFMFAQSMSNAKRGSLHSSSPPSIPWPHFPFFFYLVPIFRSVVKVCKYVLCPQADMRHQHSVRHGHGTAIYKHYCMCCLDCCRLGMQ